MKISVNFKDMHNLRILKMIFFFYIFSFSKKFEFLKKSEWRNFIWMLREFYFRIFSAFSLSTRELSKNLKSFTKRILKQNHIYHWLMTVGLKNLSKVELKNPPVHLPIFQPTFRRRFNFSEISIKFPEFKKEKKSLHWLSGDWFPNCSPRNYKINTRKVIITNFWT